MAEFATTVTARITLTKASPIYWDYILGPMLAPVLSDKPLNQFIVLSTDYPQYPGYS